MTLVGTTNKHQGENHNNHNGLLRQEYNFSASRTLQWYHPHINCAIPPFQLPFPHPDTFLFLAACACASCAWLSAKMASAASPIKPHGLGGGSAIKAVSSCGKHARSGAVS